MLLWNLLHKQLRLCSQPYMGESLVRAPARDLSLSTLRCALQDASLRQAPKQKQHHSILILMGPYKLAACAPHQQTAIETDYKSE